MKRRERELRPLQATMRAAVMLKIKASRVSHRSRVSESPPEESPVTDSKTEDRGLSNHKEDDAKNDEEAMTICNAKDNTVGSRNKPDNA